MATWNTGLETGDESTSTTLDVKATDLDSAEVIRLLDIDDRYDLYQALDINDRDIQIAELNAPRAAGVDIQAIHVLSKWRHKHSDKATRQALLDGLEKCVNIEAKEILEDIWNGREVHRRSESEMYDIIKPLGSEELLSLYQTLGLTSIDIGRAESRVKGNDVHQKARSVIRWWVKRNGKKATSERLQEAISSCRRMTNPDTLNFDLASVKQQLVDEYLETRGKLPLLPGMPEEFAKMEDLFVDLHVVKEEKMPAGVVLKELKSHGDIVCIEQEVQKGNKKVKRVIKRVLVKGKPGVGKSSAISKLAYDWACLNQDSSISKFELLFAIRINEIHTDTDLIGTIQDQLLPKISRQGLEKYLQSNASSFVILFDGYDEASKHFHESSNIKDVLCSKWLAEACVVVTTRPNQVSKFMQTYGSCLQVEIQGFSDIKRKRLYVQKFMQYMDINESAFLNHLHASPRLEELASIPIILSMLCLLWVDDQTLPSTVTSLYKEIIEHLAKHSFAKSSIDDLIMTNVQTWRERVLNQIGEVAMKGLFQDKLVFTSDEFESKALADGCVLGVIVKERKRSKLTVTDNITFLHKTFQEMTAAFFWVGMIEFDKEKFSNYLEKITSENIFEMEYLLRFACGLNLKAAEIILPHVVQIMCYHDQLRSGLDNALRHIGKNQCQQIPIFLLFEAETNNAEIGHCIGLHHQLKPLIKTITSSNEGFAKDEFHTVLSSYIDAEQSVKSNTYDKGYLWLDCIEDVCVICSYCPYVDVKVEVVNMLSAMSRLSVLCINDESKTSIRFDAGQFTQLVSCHSSLTRLVLDGVPLTGELPGAIFLPQVKELDIKDSDEACKGILMGYAKAADMFEHASQPPKSCIPLESLKVEGSLSTTNITKAVRYMLHLRNLALSYNRTMKPCDWAKLFDAFIDTAKNRHLCNHDENKSSSDARPDADLLLEKLDLSGNNIGNSIENFVSAYDYMPHLKCLVLKKIAMKVHQCEKLFNGFAITGRNGSLALEVLDISQNEIGSSVKKIAIAYGYMPHLICLNVNNGAMEVHHCDFLFDGFINAGRSQNNCLALKELGLKRNKVGDSVKKLAQAYRYMTKLSKLNLSYASLNATHCGMLCDALIEAGKLIRQNYQGNASSIPQCGLPMEQLWLSRNEIGESIDKLVEVLEYMPQLKVLALGLSCENLDEPSREKKDIKSCGNSNTHSLVNPTQR